MYVCFGQGYGVGLGSGGDGGGGGAVCVCAFGPVIPTLNPTLTQFPNPDYCSVHSAVQNGTPNRCGPMSNESESRENMNPTLTTANTSHCVTLQHLGRVCTPSPSLTPKYSSRVRLAAPASTPLSSGETARNAVRTAAGGFRGGWCTGGVVCASHE